MENYIENSDVSNLKKLGTNNHIINCKFIGNDIIIENNCTLINCEIHGQTTITDSFVENSKIGKNCKIGPYSRIRPNTIIEDNCKIGNFVEIKNSTLHSGVKASHLAYIGDAEIGKNTNIGCGVIFANYNGKTKSKTVIGNNCFIGSNCNLIAPVFISDNNYICAGTTITKNTKSGDFVIGRVKQQTKEKYKNYINTLKKD